MGACINYGLRGIIAVGGPEINFKHDFLKLRQMPDLKFYLQPEHAL
jgi:hypothetical protein